MNAQQKYRVLIEKLYQKTDENVLSWTIDDVVDEIDLKLAGSIISIGQEENDDGAPIVSARIVTSKGVVDRFSDEDLSGETPSIGEFGSYYELMLGLITLAKRKANGADAVLDGLIEALN